MTGIRIHQKFNLALEQKVLEKYALISERKANLSITGISARVYHHWKDQGLINQTFSSSENREWARLNIYDYVWLRLLKTLREFGVSIPVLQKLKEKVWSNLLDIELDEETFKRKAFLPGLTNEELSEQYNILKHTKSIRHTIPDEMQLATSFLGILTNSVIFEISRVNLILAKKADEYLFDIFSNSAKFGSGNDKEWQELPHISVPLNAIVYDFFELPENESNLVQWKFLDLKESQVLKAIREGDFKKVSISRRDKAGNFIVDITDTEEVRNDKARHLVKLFALKDYREVTLIRRNDKHILIKKKKSI